LAASVDADEIHATSTDRVRAAFLIVFFAYKDRVVRSS
jgi:hypothetical protein